MNADVPIPPVTLPVQSSVPEAASALGASLASHLPLVYLVESWKVLRSVLEDIPEDSSPSLAAVFEWMAFEPSKAGDLEVELITFRSNVGTSEADSSAWSDEFCELAKCPRPSYSGADGG